MNPLILALVMICGAQAPRDTTAGSDEARIRQIIAAEEAAWNRGDATAYAEHFQEEGSFTNILGSTYYGRPDFERRHAEIFGSIFKKSILVMDVMEIRFIRPDVAIVDIDAKVAGYQHLPPGIRESGDRVLHTRLQQVMVKEDGDWWIASYHNVDVTPP